jgi:hypothetical protein
MHVLIYVTCMYHTVVNFTVVITYRVLISICFSIQPLQHGIHYFQQLSRSQAVDWIVLIKGWVSCTTAVISLLA